MEAVWIQDEASRMSRGGRLALYSWMWIIVAGWLAATAWQALHGKYPDAAAEVLIFGYIFAVKWLWPLGVARAVRKRGGRFGRWYAIALIFGLVLPAIFFAALWNGKPITAEPQIAERTPLIEKPLG